ncbi:hypothetical protein HaLaN_28986, partial [Haematococcus lacustris]
MVWPARQPTVQSNKDPEPPRSTAPALDEHDTAAVHGCGAWPWRAWRARQPCALPIRSNIFSLCFSATEPHVSNAPDG